MKVMFIGGVIAVLIGQGLLNDLTNIDYAKLIVAPPRVFSFTSEFIMFLNLN